jgi:ubiquinone/menaquinone biosynthesis C-methylase UbiE
MTEWNAETAEWYAANYGEYPTNRLAVEKIDLPDHSTIIDVGCGTGSALRCAAAKVRDGTLIGIDPVPRMVEIAKELTEEQEVESQIGFKVGSAEELPIEDSIADIVFAFDSIDHWTDIHQGLKEVYRILKPEGKLYVVKDLGVPGSMQSLKSLELILKKKRFDLVNKYQFKSDEVSFMLWKCIPKTQ